VGKLAERLCDPARAGVYRVETTDALEEAAALNGYALKRFRLDTEDRMQALERFVAEKDAARRVALVSGFEQFFPGVRERRDALLAALAAAATVWRARGAHVFVAFLDPGRTLPALAPLYNWNKRRTSVR
jgi:hypothetical protein